MDTCPPPLQSQLASCRSYCYLAQDPGCIHLQWFAAEDEGRTFEATPRKKQKAKEEGRVLKSQEVASSLGILLPSLAILVLSPFMMETFVKMMKHFLLLISEYNIVNNQPQLFSAILYYFIALSLPLAIVGFIAALAGNLVQVGFTFSIKPITPNFSKIVPHFGQYFKKIFSLEGGFTLLKSAVKIAIIAVLTYTIIAGDIHRILSLFESNLIEALNFIFGLALRLLIAAGVILLLLSIPDYFFQRRQYLENLKMSREELKEETKTDWGDPLVKQRLRERMRELLVRSMAANVPKADVVITNPTHYAVALEYDPERQIFPHLIAKGSDNTALLIKRLARDAKVPIVENKPLARALYAEVRIGEEVPQKYLELIANIIAYAWRVSNNTKKQETFLDTRIQEEDDRVVAI